MVWPKQANYSRELLYADDSNNGTLWVVHKAAGAEKWRYTLDFGSSFSPWMSYAGGNVSIPPKDWAGTKAQAWSGEHIMVQYWNKVTGSSDHYQHGDVAWDDRPPRRYPNFWVQGGFNQFGFDSGFRNQMSLTDEGLWEYTLMTEWPAQVALNAWGVDANGQPDITQVLGDVDGDRILDRIPPISLLSNFINITDPPPWPFLSWKLSLNDGNLQIFTTPQGNQKAQLSLFILLGVVPLLTAAAAVRIYLKSFYQVKFNKVGLTKQRSWPGNLMSKNSTFRKNFRESINVKSASLARLTMLFHISSPVAMSHGDQPLAADAGAVRKTVLIATMEYDIEDWGIKIKIGGLGVMAQLMAKNLAHQNLIWVVPCVGGIEYPVDQKADPFEVRILGQVFQIQVQYHVIRNITYVLLDAPIFRAQSTSEPYPVRMDDLDSAIYYSAWNSCIAETLKRFPVDLYHINDFHGAAAPLHLLPQTIPCCLSLHNAEFQGFWPMKTQHERQEVCEIFNLHLSVVERYVQFGDVFNLLHAAASYLYVHQNGFGAVAVSKKYGRRSWARYPIFWGLKEVGSLTNPDPSDTADWTREETIQEVQVDSSYEQLRVEMKRHAQEWAGLHEDPGAELFVFVGRWSMQKGVDLIADVFPSILETYSNVQLICVGPVIDLYGRFAAIKLSKMVDLFPGRVFSKPEFTALPPFIFSGAEFALIPSRDEPFGLVAVEFGRKGALGVGSR
jgi:alpha-1,3-glucan synthase